VKREPYYVTQKERERERDLDVYTTKLSVTEPSADREGNENRKRHQPHPANPTIDMGGEKAKRRSIELSTAQCRYLRPKSARYIDE
jgi:hypothetical protein